MPSHVKAVPRKEGEGGQTKGSALGYRSLRELCTICGWVLGVFVWQTRLQKQSRETTATIFSFGFGRERGVRPAVTILLARLRDSWLPLSFYKPCFSSKEETERYETRQQKLGLQEARCVYDVFKKKTCWGVLVYCFFPLLSFLLLVSSLSTLHVLWCSFSLFFLSFSLSSSDTHPHPHTHTSLTHSQHNTHAHDTDTHTHTPHKQTNRGGR